MWLCNLFTILVCLTSFDNMDAVQEARYGKLMDPPRVSIADEYYRAPKTSENHYETTVESNDSQR